MAFRKACRRVLVTLLSAFLLLTALVALYGARVRASARALINSAKGIRTTADAERQIRAWRGIPLVEVIDEKPDRFGDRNYNVRLMNAILWRLGLVPPTMVGTTITMHEGDLRSVTVVMSTGWKPNTTSGLWLQEWFGSGMSRSFHVGQSRRPWGATVEFSSDLPEPQRGRAFALNADCLVKLGGCTNAETLLPGVWQLGTAPQ